MSNAKNIGTPHGLYKRPAVIVKLPTAKYIEMYVCMCILQPILLQMSLLALQTNARTIRRTVFQHYKKCSVGALKRQGTLDDPKSEANFIWKPVLSPRRPLKIVQCDVTNAFIPLESLGYGPRTLAQSKDVLVFLEKIAMQSSRKRLMSTANQNSRNRNPITYKNVLISLAAHSTCNSGSVWSECFNKTASLNDRFGVAPVHRYTRLRITYNLAAFFVCFFFDSLFWESILFPKVTRSFTIVCAERWLLWRIAFP